MCLMKEIPEMVTSLDASMTLNLVHMATCVFSIWQYIVPVLQKYNSQSLSA